MGRDAVRRIALIDGQQVARNVLGVHENLIVFDARRLEPESGSDEVVVTLATWQWSEPVLFTVKCVLEAAVTQFTTSCDRVTTIPVVHAT
ncbi:hypothetical protein FGB62_124g020 [Gracilaria domingensis]|nr:hypothetical protein FGB62_124g020 [Gracilaria domingensis]